ncbi:hypothetical protein EIP86_011486 [Pleurotus ostreatoroseus]|nr:hypothetical protein EIP86_011486 [Pleurotus ostreatoroseus]
MTTGTLIDAQSIQSTNPFRPSPMTPDEIAKVDQIVEVTCCPRDDALKHLRRKGGNIEQAIDAIINSEPVDDAPKTSTSELDSLRAAAAGVVSGGASKSGKTSPPTIDLTSEDDEDMKKAMQASLEDQGPTFRPSDRAPHPDWAVVPSNVQVHQDVVSQDDREMSQAIEASLHYEMANSGYDEAPLEERIRVGHRYNYSDAEPGSSDLDQRYDMTVVKVDIRGVPEANDLLSCLSQELFPERHQRQQVIFKPSEVVAFQLIRNHPTNGDREIFSFPPHLYLDQFLKENVELANSRRKLQWDLNAEIEKLNRRKLELTRHEDRDVLADLRSTIYYYENVAECEDEARKAQVADTLTKLRAILEDIETELKGIETTVTDHRAKIAGAFDCPELQNYKYDLRVVLVHDGFHGRSHIYSYVKYKGVWWKTVDSIVTEVSEETVLSDAAGLHLSAGPYFLIYSAAMSEEEENMPPPWPIELKNDVKRNNYTFFSQLPEDKRTEDPNSPLSSPYLPPMENDEPMANSEELTGLQVENVQPAAERMDLD